MLLEHVHVIKRFVISRTPLWKHGDIESQTLALDATTIALQDRCVEGHATLTQIAKALKVRLPTKRDYNRFRVMAWEMIKDKTRIA